MNNFLIFIKIAMEYLTILDFNTGEVHIHPVEYIDDAEEVVKKLGHRVNDCQWMVSNNNIMIHNEVLE